MNGSHSGEAACPGVEQVLRPARPMSVRRLAVAASLSAFALAGCARSPSALAPAGPAAARIAELWWVMFAIAAVVSVIVIALMAVVLWRRPPATVLDSPADERRAIRGVVLAGVVVPAVILIAVFVYAVYTLGALDPHAEAAELVIEVDGRQYWWDITYPDAGGTAAFRTANELHIPVGRRVELRLSSPDVIHSLWVPQLQGKTDNIPGRTNVMWLQADRPGVYRGQCAEYCGMQHAHMAFLVIAEAPDEFERWRAGQAADAVAPVDSIAVHGRRVLEGTACAACHAVRGTSARGQFGPDLTHLASRRTLASVTIPNTKGHLGGWVANPQRIKPGSRMPAVPLTGGDLQALLHYLETLR